MLKGNPNLFEYRLLDETGAAAAHVLAPSAKDPKVRQSIWRYRDGKGVTIDRFYHEFPNMDAFLEGIGR